MTRNLSDTVFVTLEEQRVLTFYMLATHHDRTYIYCNTHLRPSNR